MLPDAFENVGRQLANSNKRLETLERQEEALGWTLISDTELAGPVATIDITNIPASFKHLKILGWLRSDFAGALDGVRIRLNNIAAANYYSFNLDIVHPNVLVTTELLAATSGLFALITGATAAAALFAIVEALIPDYLDGAIKKSWQTLNSALYSTVTTSLSWDVSTGYLSSLTTAVNRITIFPLLGANFVAGSRLSLYGIK